MSYHFTNHGIGRALVHRGRGTPALAGFWENLVRSGQGIVNDALETGKEGVSDVAGEQVDQFLRQNAPQFYAMIEKKAKDGVVDAVAENGPGILGFTIACGVLGGLAGSLVPKPFAGVAGVLLGTGSAFVVARNLANAKKKKK